MPKTDLPRTLTLPQAAQRTGLTVEILTRMLDSGTLKGMKTPTGETVILEADAQGIITREQFAKLKGRPITIKQAEKEFGINQPTLTRWIQRGYINKLDDAHPAHFDTADVAYCAAVYKSKGGKSGQPLLDEHGLPYALKWPKVSEYRKRKAAAPVAPPARRGERRKRQPVAA